MGIHTLWVRVGEGLGLELGLLLVRSMRKDSVPHVTSCSSEKSPQSLSPSHSHLSGRHWPLEHWNWRSLHVFTATHMTSLNHSL